MSNWAHPLLEDRQDRRVWTKAEQGALRDLAASGHTVRECAALLGRPISSVRQKLKDLGLTKAGVARPEPRSATLREEIAAARAEWATAPLYRPGGRDG